MTEVNGNRRESGRIERKCGTWGVERVRKDERIRGEKGQRQGGCGESRQRRELSTV